MLWYDAFAPVAILTLDTHLQRTAFRERRFLHFAGGYVYKGVNKY